MSLRGSIEEGSSLPIEHYVFKYTKMLVQSPPGTPAELAALRKLSIVQSVAILKDCGVDISPYLNAIKNELSL